MTRPSDGTARAWGWTAHLREGGTTPWSQWRAPAEPQGRVLPGAQQLELLRRLNERAAEGAPAPVTLADRVLAASMPGRGLPDLPLLAGDELSAFGPRPVDPSSLPPEEVLRPGILLLAEDLAAAGRVPRPPVRRLRRWPPRRRYRLVGDPMLAGPLRVAMSERGRPPGPRGEIVILASDLGRMLGHTWVDACFRGGAGPWAEWLDGWRQRSRVPGGIDLPLQAQLWAQRRGAAHVHVVADRSRLAPLLGVRTLPPVPAQPGATAAELARRVGAALGLLVQAEDRVPLLREGLLPRLPADVLDDAPPPLPPGHHEWVAQRARRMARRLARGDYAEVPTRAELRPGRPGHGPVPGAGQDVGPRMDAVLELGLRLLRAGQDGSTSTTREQR